MIPREILSDQLEECIKGRRIVAAVFLTFEFDSGFFEQEIIPVLLNLPVSHAKAIRLVQLEDALRTCAGNIAVFFDSDRLVKGSAGSAHLDVRRIPVRHGTGVFHPKNILLLVEDRECDKDDHRARALLVGAMSANLTRSGWWENVEACHFEEIEENDRTLLTEPLLKLLRLLKQRTSATGPHPPLETIIEFLAKDTVRRERRSGNQTRFTYFYPGTNSFPDFLEEAVGASLQDLHLEIISPYLGDAPSSGPLRELIERFNPKEVRLLLPRNRDGSAACTAKLYKSVAGMDRVSWGKLPADATSGGAKDAPARFVHAKVYRFFSQNPKREFCFVGSVNLTEPAHSKGGNWETGMLVEVDCQRAPEFWLETDTSRPSEFNPDDDDDPAKSGGTPLVLQYYWDTGIARCFWDLDEGSPGLRLEMRGADLCLLPPLRARIWTQLDQAVATQLAGNLKETSFVEVWGHGDRSGLLLVQEEGMAHKPSLLLNLSAADILRYWSLLTTDQRVAFLEAKSFDLDLGGEGSDLLARAKIRWGNQTFFDRFAGMFHAFSCLEKAVREKLSEKPPSTTEADYRIFGKKYDSLSTLLDRVVSDPAMTDDIERYIILLCAQQLVQELERDFPDYWRSRKAQAAELRATLDHAQTVRLRLSNGAEHGDMPAFLDWFDAWFLKRAKTEEAAP